jgi:hypothetical protein
VNGNEQKINQPFSLDNTEVGFRLTPRILLMSDISFVVSLRHFANCTFTEVLLSSLDVVITVNINLEIFTHVIILQPLHSESEFKYN